MRDRGPPLGTLRASRCEAISKTGDAKWVVCGHDVGVGGGGEMEWTERKNGKSDEGKEGRGREEKEEGRVDGRPCDLWGEGRRMDVRTESTR